MSNLSDIVTMVVEALCGLHLLTHDDIPYFVYGHEFGALVAFEICRRVAGEFPFQALFVSSMSCPQVGDFPCIHFPYITTCGAGLLQAPRHDRFNNSWGLHFSSARERSTPAFRSVYCIYCRRPRSRAERFLRQRARAGCLTIYTLFSPLCCFCADGARARENIASVPSVFDGRGCARQKC